MMDGQIMNANRPSNDMICIGVTQLQKGHTLSFISFQISTLDTNQGIDSYKCVQCILELSIYDATSGDRYAVFRY